MDSDSAGAELRQLLSARKMSLRELARRVPIDPGQLSRVAADKRPLSYELARRCDVILDSGDVLKMLARHSGPTHEFPGTIASGEFWDSDHTVETIGRFTATDLSLDKPQANGLLASMAFGATLLEPLEGWIAHSEGPSLTGTPSPSEIRGVEEIESVAELFRTWNDKFGGGIRRKAVVGQLSEVAELLRGESFSPLLRRRLFAVMAQLAQTAASMSWDSGQGPLAQRYYMLALRASRESGDRQFGANILAGMARQVLYLDRPGDALELIRLAQDGTDDQAAPAVRAMLKTREAWAHARSGRLGAFHRATSRAEDMLRDAPGTSNQTPQWIRYFNEAELAGVTGGRLLEAAHSDPRLAADAADRIQRAITLREPNALRSSALDHIGLAEARFIQGETDEAVRVGHEALGIAERTGSHRARVKLEEFYVTTAPAVGSQVIDELRERIREVLAA